MLAYVLNFGSANDRSRSWSYGHNSIEVIIAINSSNKLKQRTQQFKVVIQVQLAILLPLNQVIDQMQYDQCNKYIPICFM